MGSIAAPSAADCCWVSCALACCRDSCCLCPRYKPGLRSSAGTSVHYRDALDASVRQQWAETLRRVDGSVESFSATSTQQRGPSGDAGTRGITHARGDSASGVWGDGATAPARDSTDARAGRGGPGKPSASASDRAGLHASWEFDSSALGGDLSMRHLAPVTPSTAPTAGQRGGPYGQPEAHPDWSATPVRGRLRPGDSGGGGGPVGPGLRWADGDRAGVAPVTPSATRVPGGDAAAEVAAALCHAGPGPVSPSALTPNWMARMAGDVGLGDTVGVGGSGGRAHRGKARRTSLPGPEGACLPVRWVMVVVDFITPRCPVRVRFFFVFFSYT